MIRLYIKFALVLLTLMPLLASAQAPAHRSTAPRSAPHAQPTDTIGPLSHIQPPPANYAYANGTTLVFNAEWRLWTAGTATLRLDSAGDQERVTATADSAGVVALLYTVHDRFEAFFDRRTFCSQRITKHTEEGFHKKDTVIRFDYGTRKAILDERNLKNDQLKHAQEPIPGCVMDVVSGLYYVGSLPLQNGASYTFPLNDGGKTIDVRATVEGREQVRTDAGTFSTVRVRTEDASGALKKRGAIWIWYTDDVARIPVQMRARAFWGTLNFRLARVERK